MRNGGKEPGNKLEKMEKLSDGVNLSLPSISARAAHTSISVVQPLTHCPSWGSPLHSTPCLELELVIYMVNSIVSDMTPSEAIDIKEFLLLS